VAASPAPVVLTTRLGAAAGTHSAVELHTDRTDESAAPAAARRSAPAQTAYAPRAPADTAATAHPSSTRRWAHSSTRSSLGVRVMASAGP
jgi:hypothetical protein